MTCNPLFDAVGEPLHFYDYGEVSFGVLPGMTPQQMKDKYDNVKDIELLSDDVLLMNYPKTGLHWLYEILNMLLKGRAELCPKGTITSILELASPEEIASKPSPRLLATHLPPSKLPENVISCGCKIITTFRNPKDVAVSLYYQLARFPFVAYKGKWENFLASFMSEMAPFCNMLTWIDRWYEWRNENPGIPVHTVMYEDLKKDSLPVVKKLAEFLGASADDDFIRQVMEKCSLTNMKKNELIREMNMLTIDGEPLFTRKGIIGDWKNHFTVAQNESFDAWLQNRMKKSKWKMDFEYE